jgi:DNA modification methylase
VIELNKIYNEDCMETMSRMPDNFVDLVLTDPPYGVEKAEWDSIAHLMGNFYQ